MNEICRMLVWYDGKSEFSSISVEDNNVVEADKKYGFLHPKNGVLTFSITNRDGELSEKAVDRAVKFALKEWSLYVPITFKKVSVNGDIRVEFRNEYEDKILNKNTLAYMYYPMGGKTNGLCVVNTRFYWTNHGKGVDMHKIDPTHYPTPQDKVKGQSWDLDQVLRHEFGHGIFGLPHNVNPDNIMSSNYGKMNERITESDVFRARAKAGKRELSQNLLRRWINWLTGASDREY